MKKRILIIGAGPAGLCAAHELTTAPDFRNTDIVICDLNRIVGGLSRTETFKGNKIDIGGHRFFSKSDTVMDWWMAMLPMQGKPAKDDLIQGRSVALVKDGPDPETTDKVFLRRIRLSRILYLRKLFPYPVSLSLRTIRYIGGIRLIAIGCTYVLARLFPRKPEKTLEDFLINRFGCSLYRMFFREYTRKVWGVPCCEISSEWGKQRIKGVSVLTALKHALTSTVKRDTSLHQKSTETSLINNFLYPKRGPGQLWEIVADNVKKKGVTIRLEYEVTSLKISDGKIVAATLRNGSDGQEDSLSVDAVFSSMPIKNLIRALGDHPPVPVRKIASGLIYRDFITVGVLLKKITVPENSDGTGMLTDNCIYVQENDVLLGRIQIFNNWSPYMVHNEENVWVGFEYFCAQGDSFWSLPDTEIANPGVKELQKLAFITPDDVIETTVIRAPYAYPAYFGSYKRFPEVRAYLDTVENLFCIGRNGMHRYNNTDHSMLSAMTAVDVYLRGENSREAIWSVNAEQEYHEKRDVIQKKALRPTSTVRVQNNRNVCRQQRQPSIL